MNCSDALASAPNRIQNRSQNRIQIAVDIAAAIELKIRIVVAPFTQADAARPWVISTYQDAASIIPENRNVYLGNNDVHYMWLSRSILG